MRHVPCMIANILTTYLLDINCESQKVHAKIVCTYIFRSYLRSPFCVFSIFLCLGLHIRRFVLAKVVFAFDCDTYL